MRPSNSELMFAILLKPGPITRKGPSTGTTTTETVPEGTFAGIAGLAGHPANATADLGQLLLTRFQRTFVGTHANALLLHHLLDRPEAGGLALRRVQWQCNASNEASVRAARRLGFVLEGIIRWQQVLPVEKTASEGAEMERERMPKAPTPAWADVQQWGPGRHTAMLSLCWDDWVVAGGREHIDALVSR